MPGSNDEWPGHRGSCGAYGAETRKQSEQPVRLETRSCLSATNSYLWMSLIEVGGEQAGRTNATELESGAAVFQSIEARPSVPLLKGC